MNIKNAINNNFFNIRSGLLVCLLLAGSVLVVYWQACSYDFVVFDDRLNVYDNPFFKRFSFDNLFLFWVQPHQRLYIPVTYNLWGVVAGLSQYLFNGSIDPACFHTANLILHIINVILVYVILRAIIFQISRIKSSTRINFASGIGALLFAMHPVQVEPIAWVTGMKDLLCGLFSLLTILMYINLEQKCNPRGMSNKKFFSYAVVAFVFLLALLAKPSAVVVPFFMALLSWGILRRPFRKVAPLVIFLFLMASIITTVTIIIQPTGGMNYEYPLHIRPLVASDALVFYLYKLIYPCLLIIDYGRTPDVVLSSVGVYLKPVLIGCVFLLIYMLKDKRTWFACVGLFIAGVLPVLGFLPFEFQSISTVADRYLYMSILGPALALGVVVNNYYSTSLKILSILVISVFGVLSAFQVAKWENTITITSHTLEKNPNSFMANLNLGVGLIEYGRFEDAIAYYKRALEIEPGSKMAYYNMGIAYASLNNQTKAMEQYNVIKGIDPNQAGRLLHAINRINEIGKVR
jgi:hypothetical protein